MVYIVSVGFALWIDGDQAWAQGTHEYRPMGVAVIAITDHFKPRDFLRRRPAPSPFAPTFEGLYASIGELNVELGRRRTRRYRRRPGAAVRWLLS